MPLQNEADHRAWVIENADYFTVVRFKPLGQTERHEFKTLAEADTEAQRMFKESKNARYMLYAVAGVHDVFVKSFK